MTRLPGLLNAQLQETARLKPSAASLTLKLKGTSEAALTLPEDEPAVGVHDWVSIYTQRGFAGVFRVTNAAQRYRKQVELTLLHGIDILSDSVWAAQTEFTGTKAEFLAALLNQQTRLVNGQKPWAAGTCADSSSLNKKKINYDRLSTLLESLVEDGGDYCFSYDQTSFPWTVSIVAKPSGAATEFRLARNVQTATVTYNDADLCTRLVVSVNKKAKSSTTKTTSNAHVIRTYDNAAAQQEWGVVVKTADIDTQDNVPGGPFPEADAWAANYLAQRSAPTVQIQIDGAELCGLTGDTWDEVSIGKMCQVALPAYGKTFLERVVSVTYPELLKTPGRVTVSLANTLPKVSESIASATKTASAAAAGARSAARDAAEAEELVTMVQKTGVNSLGEEETLYSKITQNATAITTEVSRASAAEGTLRSVVTQTADKLQSVVSSTLGDAGEEFSESTSYAVGDVVTYNGQLYRFTTAHPAGAWNAEHVTPIGDMFSQITQQAGLIDLVVDSSGQQAGIRIGSIADALNSAPGVSIYGSKIDISTLTSAERQTWENKLGFVTSAEIVITDEQISQVVQRVEETVVDDATQEVTQTVLSSASLILAINGDGSSSAAISADKIQLSGSTTIDGLLGTESVTGGTALKVKGGAVSAPLGYYTGSAGEYHLNASGNLTCDSIDVGYGSPVSMDDTEFSAFGLHVTGGSSGSMKYGGKVVLTEDNDYIASLAKITSGLSDGQFGFSWTKLSGTTGQITFNIADTAWYSGRVSAFKSAVSTALGSAGWNGATGKSTQIYGSLSTAQGKLVISQATAQITYPGDESPTTVNIGLGSLDVSSALSSYAASIREDALESVSIGSWQIENGAASVAVTAGSDPVGTVDMLPAANWDVSVGAFSSSGATVVVRPTIGGVYGNPVKTASVANPVNKITADTFSPAGSDSFLNRTTLKAVTSVGTQLGAKQVTLARANVGTSYHYANLHLGADSSGPLIARLNVHPFFDNGWAGCYNTIELSQTTNRQLSPGESLTIKARAKAASTDSGKTDVKTVTITAPPATTVDSIELTGDITWSSTNSRYTVPVGVYLSGNDSDPPVPDATHDFYVTPKLTTYNITSNGYYAPSSAIGYSSVTVNVPTYSNSASLTRYRAGAVEQIIPGQLYRKNQNGTYTALGDSSTYWYATKTDLGGSRTVHY